MLSFQESQELGKNSDKKCKKFCLLPFKEKTIKNSYWKSIPEPDLYPFFYKDLRIRICKKIIRIRN